MLHYTHVRYTKPLSYTTHISHTYVVLHLYVTDCLQSHVSHT